MKKIKLTERQLDFLKLIIKKGDFIYQEPHLKWFTFKSRHGYIPTNTAKALIAKGVLSNESSEDKSLYYVTDFGKSLIEAK